MKQTLLQVEAVQAGYSGPLVGPLSFAIERGERIGLFGPNGAGKSTLLAAITGQARVFSGHIERPGGLRLAYQSQRPQRNLEVPLTGREFLRFADALHHEPPPRLLPMLDQRIDRLSGGQFQLLTIWACLGSEADLILLDEPTNNLDPHTVEDLAALLESGTALHGVLLISHDRDFLERTCHRSIEVRPWA